MCLLTKDIAAYVVPEKSSGEIKCPENKLIGVKEAVDEMEKIVLEKLPEATGVNYRVPPLTITRLARGGKTTLLVNLTCSSASNNAIVALCSLRSMI